MTEIIECLPNDLKLKLKNLYSTYKLDTEIRKDNKGISNVKIYSIRNLANHVLCYGVIENYLYDPIRFNERGYTINVICDSINPKIFNIVYISDIDNTERESILFFVKQVDVYYVRNPKMADKWVISGTKPEYGTIFLSDTELSDIMKEFGIDDDIINETLEKYKNKDK